MTSPIDTAMMLDDETFDARAALVDLVLFYEDPTQVGLSYDGAALRDLALKSKRGNFSEVAEDKVKLLICTLYNIARVKMSEKVQKQYNAKYLLETLKNPVIKLPEAYRQIAEALYAEYNAMNWGVVAAPIVAESAKRSNKRAWPTQDGPLDLKRPRKITFVPNKNDRNWGPDGIMRHIIKYKIQRTTYAIDPNYINLKPTANKFGHNGLTIGDCWPIQFCLIRDGAHGESQGGITGTGKTGCYSIIVASGYEDSDQGKIIDYAEPSAHNTEETNVDEKAKKGALALTRSLETKNQVRVIRKYTGDWSGRPRAGFRYDGLYKVVSFRYKERENASGKYKLFRLVWDDNCGQPEPDESRPTMEERKLFEKVTAPIE